MCQSMPSFHVSLFILCRMHSSVFFPPSCLCSSLCLSNNELFTLYRCCPPLELNLVVFLSQLLFNLLYFALNPTDTINYFCTKDKCGLVCDLELRIVLCAHVLLEKIIRIQIWPPNNLVWLWLFYAYLSDINWSGLFKRFPSFPIVAATHCIFINNTA